jgi:hypothetical protein
METTCTQMMRYSPAVLLFVLTRTSLALRERKPFFTFTSSPAFGPAFPISFRQILVEFKVCERFGGTDDEGSRAEEGMGGLECLEDRDRDGVRMGLGRGRISFTSECDFCRKGTGMGRDVAPIVLSPVFSFDEIEASGTDVPADVGTADGNDMDEDDGEGESLAGEEGSETSDNSVCRRSSSSSTTSTLPTTPASPSNAKIPSEPAA